MLLPPFIQKRDDPISMESRQSPSKTEGEGGPFFVRYDMFFLLDSHAIRIFCPKECLTTLRVVMCMTHTRLSSKRSFGCLFKEVNRPGETMSRRYMPYPIGDVCLDLICN